MPKNITVKIFKVLEIAKTFLKKLCLYEGVGKNKQQTRK